MKSKKTPHLPTAKQRELGAELRRIRMRAGYLATDMSRMLGWPASTISRLESGLRNYQAGDIAVYLARAKATPRELDELVALDRRPDDGYQVRSHPAGFPDDLSLINVLYTGSQSITTYAPVDIPRQLQIEPYIREALTKNGHKDGPALDTAVQTRLAGQTDIRKPSLATFYLHETTFCTDSHSSPIAYEQMLHVLIVSSLPSYRIHLVPANSPFTENRTGFTIYKNEHYRPVVHLQQPTTSLFLECNYEISFYTQQLERIADEALTCQQTRDWLSRKLTEHERHTA